MKKMDRAGEGKVCGSVTPMFGTKSQTALACAGRTRKPSVQPQDPSKKLSDYITRYTSDAPSSCWWFPSGVMLLAVVVWNGWETFMVVLGLLATGLGQGTLAAVLFNVLVAASSKKLAGDTGSLRGAAKNLAGAVGTASPAASVCPADGIQARWEARCYEGCE